VTVSRVLNNHHNVTAGVRQRVLQAAADLGYLRQRSRLSLTSVAGALAAGPAPMLRDVGFLFTSVVGNEDVSGNPFWSLVLHGVEREATAAGMQVAYRSITQWADRPDLLVETIGRARLDGILLVGPASEGTVRALQGRGQPIVLVDNAVPSLPVDAVLSDNFGGGLAAVAHLVQLGHRDVAFIGGPYRVSPPPLGHRTNVVWSIEQRAQGCMAALREAGIPPNPALCEGDKPNTAGGYAACRRLLAGAHRFTAVFCANDGSAIGAMRALHEAGLAVPGDVSVVGFDDIEVAQHMIPPLTTVRVDKEAIGAQAVRTLVARALAPDATPSTTELHVSLVQRGTTAALR
jgi:LacI family transcriptional regulator